MKIAQVAPLFERVPPKLYGGTERVVSYLTDELVDQGHQVTLFASGDSLTKAQLVSPCPRALRLDKQCIDPLAHHVYMLELVSHHAQEFDIIHFHIDYLHFPLFKNMKDKCVTTLHGRLDIPDLIPISKQFQDLPRVSISLAQREPLSWVYWIGNVYHGLPFDLYDFQPERGEYLAFLGRICPEKRVDRAIAIAQKTGIPLRIAAKVDRADQAYYEQQIKPLLNHPLIDFIGEIGEDQKQDFLGHAKALLFPIDWPEPFGLVMIEALACGTPVIAYNRGSVPEVLDHGVTGFIVEDFEEAVCAVEAIDTIDREACRRVFEERFTVSAMANAYLSVYQKMMGKRPQLAAA